MKDEYKMTELGEIPKEWEVKSLVTLVNKTDRYSFTGGPFGSDLKSEHYTTEGIRVIQLQNIGEGYFYDNYKIFTSEEKANELINCNIYPTDIIIAKMAEPVARACKIPEYYRRYLMCSDGIRLSVDRNQYDTDYIMYSINSDYFRKNAIASSTGTTRLRIGLSELKNLKVLCPLFPEQQKIASILSTVDEHIDQTEALIEKTKELKKGLMQKLLTKGIGHTEFKQTELGEIPKEWEVKKVNEVCNVTKLAGFEFTEYIDYIDDGEIIALRALNLKNGKLILNDVKRIDKNISEKLIRSKLHQDDIVFSYVGTIGEIAIIPESNTYHLAPNVAKISVKVEDIPQYICHYFTSFLAKREIKRFLTTTSQPALSMGNIRELLILIPPLPEQQKIASILSEVDNQIDQYESKKAKLRELKKGLMQKLLTGKIRVKVDATV